MEKIIKMELGDKIIVESKEQIMVLTVIESSNNAGMLVYRPLNKEERTKYA